MRTSWLIGCVVVGAATNALANPRIVVMTGNPEAEQALQISIAGRGAELVAHAVPEAELRFDRAAVAQHAVRDANAAAGVWVEPDPVTPEVYVVSTDGKVLRHAPLPVDATPRMFAAIVTSLLDEVLAGGEAPAPFNVDVRVEITAPPGATVTQQVTQTPIAPAPPATVVVAGGIPGTGVRAVTVDSDAHVYRANKTQIEVGMMASTVGFGFESAVMIPIATQWRLGLVGGVGSAYDTTRPHPYYAGGELRHVGSGLGHWDIGLFGGRGSAEYNTGTIAALRLSRAHEYEMGTFRATLAPTVLFSTYQSQPVLALWGSLLWAFEV